MARTAPDADVLYREQHFLFDSADGPRELVLYRCPDGRPFARKWLDTRTPQTPDFALLDARSGYREGVRTQDGRREVYVHRVGAKDTPQAALTMSPNAVIDSGFDAFVRTHWDALAAGRTLKVEFLVPSRLKFMHFKVARRDDPAAARHDEMVLRLQLDSWIAFALPHIDVGYALDTRRLRWFRGLSNLRDLRGENLTVSLRYPSDLREDRAPAAALQAARDASLDGRCRLR
ncbi:hypothetical protein LF63_0100990 [Oleiagrimonas soli]|uniref:Uncharacterized protein n=1 Tax=Oleiagrimonas soli TaxID=1543381 RepID=A0A099CYS8_9GAMM|nr:hypothetical protein LF63_0100990 [Oleiagrimonas soli]